MQTLPVIEAPAPRNQGRNQGRNGAFKAWVFQIIRIAMILAIAWSLHRVAATNSQQRLREVSEIDRIAISDIQTWFPEAARVEGPANEIGLHAVVDSAEKVLGYIGFTLPQAQNVVGYRGPTQSLIALDPSGNRLLGIRCIDSRDTPEHVKSVLEDQRFFQQFTSWEWGQNPKQIDAVSGATLTSLAIAESVIVRIGGEKPGLRFPHDLTLDDAQKFWPNADRVQSNDRDHAEVFDATGTKLGSLLRSGQLVDAIEGYQGPTEVLIAFDLEERSIGIKLRESYDNQPYVRYVQTEASFWKRYKQKSLDELAAMDPKREGIEGVSGATMTSQAVATTIPTTIQRELQRRQEPAEKIVSSPRSSIRLSVHEIGTLMILIGGIVLAHSQLRGWNWLRRVWQVLLIGYFGMITGNLLSQALLFGWAQGGVAWQLAPGLATMAAVALLWPATTKRNLYCHHLCPHGAAQHLVRGLGGHGKLPSAWHQRLSYLPGVLLLAMLGLSLLHLPINLAQLEPFDAYLWRIAGWGSIALAIGSLLIASRYSMAYCQYGCATGRLLEYLRRTGRSDQWSRADSLVLLVAGVATLLTVG